MKPLLLWVTDPWNTLDHGNDTTLRLIQESLQLGMRSFWCDVKTVRWENSEVKLDAYEVLAVGKDRKKNSFRFDAGRSVQPRTFHRILYRTDPPVDLPYLHPLQLLVLDLKLAGSTHCEIVNAPDVLFTGTEKLEGAFLNDLMPPSCASSSPEALYRFGIHEKATVLKPLHQCQSKGVRLLEWTTPARQTAAKKLLRQATENFQKPVLLQRFLPGIHKGEQRLWFLNGRLLASARKVPKQGEFRINMDRGASLVKTSLTSREKKAAEKIGKHLRNRKIRLAAIDLIDGYVTDFNFTSPGLLLQIEQLEKTNLAAMILKSLIRDW